MFSIFHVCKCFKTSDVFWILSNLKKSLNFFGFWFRYLRISNPIVERHRNKKIPGKFHKFHQQSPVRLSLTPIHISLFVAEVKLFFFKKQHTENSWEIEPSELGAGFSVLFCFLSFLAIKKKRALVLQAPEVPRGTPKEVLRILSSDTRCSKKKSSGVGKLGNWESFSRTGCICEHQK